MCFVNLPIENSEDMEITKCLEIHDCLIGGMKYKELCDKLIELAFRRQRNRDNLTFTIDTNILSGVSFGKAGSKGGKL